MMKIQLKLLIKLPTALCIGALFVSVGSRGEKSSALCQSPYWGKRKVKAQSISANNPSEDHRYISSFDIMERLAGICVCVCGIWISIKQSNPCGINAFRFIMFYTNLNSVDAKSHWTHHKGRTGLSTFSKCLWVYVLAWLFLLLHMNAMNALI